MMLQNEYISQESTIDQAADGAMHGLWMPVQAAEGAADIDFAFYFILAICTFFFFLIVGLGILFVIKYRKRDGYVPKPSPHHSLKLEITWSVIPIFLCVFMFWFGFSGYMYGRTMPEDAENVNVIGQKWSWNFEHPGGVFVPNELHVKVGEPVQLTMRSKDVLHSLFIPAFRVKLDVVPGRYSKVWFTPTKVGEYQLFCTEYCGTQHSYMAARVFVHEEADYDEWYDVAARWWIVYDTPEEAGKKAFDMYGCAACHTTTGVTLVGPPLNETFGAAREFEDGTSVVADENYIRESLLVPKAKVVKGFPDSMTSFQWLMKDDEIDLLIAYLKSLAETN